MSGLSTREKVPATKAELREEIRQLRHVGSQMSNVCFKLERDCKMLKELQTEWDAIKISGLSK